MPIPLFSSLTTVAASGDAASIRRQVPLPGRTRVSGDLGAVTAMSQDAANVGARILAEGGNAADAAVAATLAGGVVEPSMNGLGGAAYAVAFDPRSGATIALDGSTRCPDGAREDLFEPLTGVGGGLYGFPPTRGDLAETGALAALPPTTPATLHELQRRLGRLPFPEVVAPAIRLAEDGFLPDWTFCLHVAAGYRRLRRHPAAFALYTRDSGVPFVPRNAADRLRLPELAGSLRTLAEEGPEPFHRGRIARRLLAGVREAGGIWTEADLEASPVREVKLLRFRFRGRDIVTLPANSGGPTLAAALLHLDAFPPAEAGAEVDFLHLAAEALRMAFEDRFRYLGDPEAVPVPLPGLLDAAYLAARRKGVSPQGPRVDDGPGPPLPGASDGDCTTHVNAMDADGMAVSLTATLGARFGSAFSVAGLGYPLNNGMMWFDPRPGRRISPGPGKRALHAAAPALVFHRGAPTAVVGSPGGRRLISATVMLLARHLDRGLPVAEAAAAAGLHVDAGPVFLDERTPACREVAAALERRGHVVQVEQETALTGHFGRAGGIQRTASGWFEPGVDPVRTAAGAVARTPAAP